MISRPLEAVTPDTIQFVEDELLSDQRLKFIYFKNKFSEANKRIIVQYVHFEHV